MNYYGESNMVFGFTYQPTGHDHDVPVGFLPGGSGVPDLLTDQQKYQSDGLMEDLYR